MLILVLNAGSSSLKYQLIGMDTNEVLARGVCERIGIDGRLIHKVPGKADQILNTPIPTHAQGINLLLGALSDREYGVIGGMEEIGAVGHRIVHGGPYFTKSTVVTPDVLKKLEKCVDLAPLHIGPSLMGINGALEYMPETPQALVFDTAFHQTMPPCAYTYALSKKVADKHKIRRYGFHGTSHKYVSGIASRALAERGVAPGNAKIVTCHLGNGSSVTAVKGGESVDTSMGFTPLEGLVMGSRTGSLDPAVVPFIMEKEHMDTVRVGNYLNKECGLLGVSEVSSDLRELMDARAGGNPDAALAFDILCYGIKKYIGAYAAAMGGLDAVVFTAGIGENNPEIREDSLKGLEFMGIELDAERNANAKKIGGDCVLISTDASRVRVYLIPTNEEYVIASETLELVK